MEREKFLELIKKRHTTRKFLPDSIPDEDVIYMAEAARLAPTAQNQQQWKFIAIRNKELITKMAELVDEVTRFYGSKIPDEKSAQRLEKYKFYYLLFKEAPLVFVILGKQTDGFFQSLNEEFHLGAEKAVLADPDILSLGGAIENMILAGTALGYGSTWMTGPLIDQKKLEQLLEIEEPFHIVSLLAVGKPDRERSGPVKKELNEIFRFID